MTEDTTPQVETSTENTKTTERVFYARTQSALAVKRFTRLMDKYIEEAYVNVTENYVELHNTDTSMVVHFRMRLKPDLFNASGIETGAEDTGFGVNVPELKSAVSTANKSDRLAFEIVRDESGNHSIRVLIDDVEEEVLDSVPTSEPDAPRQQLDFDHTVCVDRSNLVSATNLFDKSFEIAGGSDKLSLSGDGVAVEFDFEDSGAELIEDSGVNHSSLFKTEYFEPLSKLRHTVDSVSVSFATDYPCIVEAGYSGVEASVLIAPRIEEG